MLEGRGSADNQSTLYRPHIDGLRAIAVLSVIAFHVSAKLLPGGYLGVDIFFVISGFLITSVIWRESKNGEFSILRFYERRIRRIMPALIVLLAATAALSTLLFLPIDLTGFASSLIAGLSFVANIFFWRTTSYFTQLANERPLLHLWSLGVEEQFYILFPLLVLVLAKKRASALLPLVSILAVLSLAADIFAIRVGATSPAFYLLPTRAWEIGAGCILALAPAALSKSKSLRLALEGLAVLFLIIGLFFNGLESLHSPLPPAFWVVVGTSLIIYFGDAGVSWLTRTLSVQALVWVGLISYSLYLWHWPILVFARYYFIQNEFPVIQTLCMVALMFALATLSWRYIERPFRNRRMPIRTVCTWVASGAACLLAGAFVLLLNHGFPGRFNPSIAQINASVGSEFRCSLSQTFPFGGYRACLIGVPGISAQNATVALVGNSHAGMYAPLVSQALQETGQGAVLAGLNSCVPMPDLNSSRDCMDAARQNLSAVESLPHVRVVVLATTWFLKSSMVSPTGKVSGSAVPAAFSASLDRLIDRLLHDGKSVVLVGPLAVPGYDVASVIGRRMAFGQTIQEPLSQSESAYMAEYGEILAHFSSRKDITFIRPDRIQCISGKCDFFRDGMPLFADDSHLAQASLSLFRPAFEPALLQAFR